MKNSFEYFYVTKAYGELDIEDIGNCAIEASNDQGAFAYLVIRTNLGISEIFTYGPTCPDLNVPCKSCLISFKRLDYSESKIIKIIEQFLSNPSLQITQAIEVTKEDALANCRDLIEYMKAEVVE